MLVNSTTQRCSTKRCTLSCEYLRKFSKKLETALLGYSGAWGILIHEKTWSRKSRGPVPLSPSHSGNLHRLWLRKASIHSSIEFKSCSVLGPEKQNKVDKFISSVSGTLVQLIFFSQKKLYDWPVSYVVPVVPGGLEPVLCEDGDGEGGGVLVLVPHAAQRHQVGHLNATEQISANLSYCVDPVFRIRRILEF